MKKLMKSATFVTLLTGAALVGSHAFAQEPSATTGDVKRLMQDNTARESAPGQREKAASSSAKVDRKVEGTAAGSTSAPDSQKRDSVTMDPSAKPERSARDNAPGQRQRTGEASATDAAPGQQQKSGETTARDAAPGRAKDADSANSGAVSSETTASVNISTEQRTEIREVIVENKVRPVTVDFDVRVGIEVPRTVELRPLPPRIIEIVPAYRGYEFFMLADGRIVIVRPNTLEVVYIITA